MDLYIVIATRRSGHHAIINWLDSILPNAGVFIEDTDWVYNKPLFVPNLKNSLIEYLDHDLSIKTKLTNGYSYCIFNIEERELSYIKECIAESSGWSNVHLIINHRSFLNFLSSKINHPVESKQPNLTNGVVRWGEYSDEILHPTIFDTFTTILFDKWVQSLDYRKEIVNIFHGDITNEITHKVPENGMGSTFDGMSKNGNAKNMDVLNRTSLLSDDMITQSENAGYVELSNKIFQL